MAHPPSAGNRIGKRSHLAAPQVKHVTFQLRNECVTKFAGAGRLVLATVPDLPLLRLARGRPPWLRKRSLAGQARPMLELDEYSQRFWAWRARQQPRTRDDIPRLARPARWRPEVEAALAVQRRDELGAFESELTRIRPDADAVP